MSTMREMKRGPKRQRCNWCESSSCSHCQCMGYTGCAHDPSVMCLRKRYRRRLICNSCGNCQLNDNKSLKSNSNDHPAGHMRSASDGELILPNQGAGIVSLSSKLANRRKSSSATTSTATEIMSRVSLSPTIAATSMLDRHGDGDDTRRRTSSSSMATVYSLESLPPPTALSFDRSYGAPAWMTRGSGVGEMSPYMMPQYPFPFHSPYSMMMMDPALRSSPPPGIEGLDSRFANPYQHMRFVPIGRHAASTVLSPIMESSLTEAAASTTASPHAPFAATLTAPTLAPIGDPPAAIAEASLSSVAEPVRGLALLATAAADQHIVSPAVSPSRTGSGDTIEVGESESTPEARDTPS